MTYKSCLVLVDITVFIFHARGFKLQEKICNKYIIGPLWLDYNKRKCNQVFYNKKTILFNKNNDYYFYLISTTDKLIVYEIRNVYMN